MTSIQRPAIDVVVPFAGSDSELAAVRERLRGLALGPDDTLTIVDNRPADAGAEPEAGLLRAPDRQSSYHARNRGAAAGSAPWLLFLDADVIAPADLIDRYFAEPVAATTAVLAGGIRDLPPAGNHGLAERYARMHQPLSDETTWQPGFVYAQTASAAVRREAFDAVGGFAEIRSGGDADLCFRLAAVNWGIERRPGATVEHRSRSSMSALICQHVRYGAGTEWLAARYPGFAPRRAGPRALIRFVRGQGAALRALARRDGDEAVKVAVGSLCAAAMELGRWVSNDVGSPA